MRHGDYERALDLMRMALTDSPGSERAQGALLGARRRWGEQLQELHRHSEALAVFREILDERPGDEEAEAPALDRTRAQEQ